MNKKTSQRIHRHRKIRMKIAGDSARPRLAIFRSNRFVSAQLIDDKKGVTIASASDMGKAGKELGVKVSKDEQRKIAYAKAVGTKIAELAKAKKVTKVVFDRAGFIYTGRVKALAEAARAGGLEF